MFHRVSFNRVALLQSEIIDMPPFGRFINGCELSLNPSSADLHRVWAKAMGKYKDVRAIGLRENVLIWDANLQVHDLVLDWLPTGRPDLAAKLAKPPVMLKLITMPVTEDGKINPLYPFKGPPGLAVGVRTEGGSTPAKMPARLQAILVPLKAKA